MSVLLAYRISAAARLYGLSCTSIRKRFERRTLGYLRVRPSLYRILTADALKLDPRNDDWREDAGIESIRRAWSSQEHVTVPEFAASLSMSAKLMRAMARDGEVPFRRVGRDWILDAELARAWLEAHYEPTRTLRRANA
ncbi:MAG: hypothetical protein KDC95_13515 [Planctomycetes bacterium]|nr:hypothetical protein [Planctomycetota bacterium]